jgi:hypothetical protein
MERRTESNSSWNPPPPPASSRRMVMSGGRFAGWLARAAVAGEGLEPDRVREGWGIGNCFVV